MENKVQSSGNQVDTLLRLAAVKEATGLGRSTIYDLMGETPPQFPRPIKLTQRGKAVAWLASEIAQWQRDRIAQRDRSAI
ncbi:helix-turn-helix transcriptional regulator [Tardiphaga robiniae]|uniref:helix-turn-helix transcriptional regulator n=1 Tax=Tardiphaga robiniae TaxID=943830 RepID=UPI0015866C6A|nr:AlpA family phage regulatory protein [Tardiphaga robiniae]NUU44556.1 AlpA family phage regulatory protein [Tardiphaga robiniae]